MSKELDDPFTCLLHNCKMSRAACERRRNMDSATAWANKIEWACDLCRNPEVTKHGQASRSHKIIVKCYYCQIRRPKDEMQELFGYNCKYKCRDGCDPERLRKIYEGKNPTLRCYKCHKSFPREIMVPYGKGNSYLCPECEQDRTKRQTDCDRTGLTEWKCRGRCGKVKKRKEFYVYDLNECKSCKSQRSNKRNK